MIDPNFPRIAVDSAASATAPDRMALLHTLAFTALRLCAAQLEAFTIRLEQVLASRPTGAASAAEEDLFRKAHHHLRSHRNTFQRLVGDYLQRELMEAVQDAADHAASGLESGAMDLSLITFDAMERKVIIDNLSQAIDRTGMEELALLSLRIGHWLQAGEIGLAHNPFRSEVFLKAVSQAWGTFDTEDAAHRLVLRQMEPAVFLQLVPVWRALNQELALRHVLPETELVHLRRGSPAGRMPLPPADEALRQWLAPEGMLHVIDARAAAMADAMFLQLSRIAAIPERFRQLLASLQAPLKQAILADTRFFFDKRHPLRRLLESCIAAGLGCRRDADGEDLLLQAIDNVCARIPHVKSAEFDAMADELDALSAREERIPEARVRDAIAEAINRENVSQAERRAEQDILARIENGEVDTFIETFLQVHWLRVLVFAYGVRDVKPDVLEKVLAAMDELLWSVQPKQSAEARNALLDRLPALLSMLNAWLNVVKWEGPEREAFFSTLAEHHAAAMRGTETCARRVLEIRMDTVQRASEHQLMRRAQEQRETVLAPFMQEIDGVDPGNWFEFVRNDGSKVNCKLLWVSPARSRFIFAGRQGQLLFTLDRDALAQGMRAERVVRIPAGALIGVALSAALEELSAS